MKSKNQFQETELRKIPNDWQFKSIENVCKLVKKIHVHNNNKIRPYIGLENVEEGTLRLDSISTNKSVKSSKYMFKKGQILFGKLRPYFRKVIRPNFDGVCSTEIWVIDSKPGFNNAFLFYFFANQDFVKEATNSSTGTRMPRASWDYLSKLKKPFPPPKEQDVIASILSGFDNKIKLNIQMNSTLEAMCKNVFKKWFVDFDFPTEDGKPYQKSGGEMADSELGKIPNGWKVKTLGKLIKFIKGKKPEVVSEKSFKKSKPLILISVLNGGKPIYANPKGMTNVNSHEPIMVMDGASSGRIEIGYNGIVGSTLAKISITTSEISSFYLYYFLKNIENEIMQNTTGTSIPHADKDMIYDWLIAVPSQTIQQEFDEITKKIFEKIMLNGKEIFVLSEIRDSLLPKLILGRIRVNTL